MKNELKNDPLMPMKHSCEHVMHLALTDLFPGLKRAMGPATAEGFYHDFDYSGKITEEDFPRIEKRMNEIIKQDLPIVREEISEEEARKMFAGNEYKLDWVDQIVKRGEKLTLYWTGKPNAPNSDPDLCSGPHVSSTGKVGPFKLLSIAGAYWHGDEKNKMLTRIYGTCFTNQEELNKYLWQLEEAKKRDNRKLGKELEIYTISQSVGPGLILWLPNGTIIRDELEKLGKEVEKKYNYQRVTTPHIGKEELYTTSGHLPYYAQDMWPPMEYEGQKYYVKPMNCPHMHMIYKFKPRSYKDLPIRYAEFGTVYRHEDSGTLLGLLRVRGHTTNDAHIYCAKEHVIPEIVKVMEMHSYYYNLFGIKDFYVELALPDFDKKADKYFNDRDAWKKATELLRDAAKEINISVVEKEGGAAFYGPKFDFNVKSVIGREFGASTNQLDFGSGERFKLTYINKTGVKETIPYIIHRAPLGSEERFIGFLIEHYAGSFPVWLSPVQVVLVPITDLEIDYAQKVKSRLEEVNIRVELDDRTETMQSKIRDAENKKVPYIFVLGKKEQASDSVSVRLRGRKDFGIKKTDEIIVYLKDKITSRSLDL